MLLPLSELDIHARQRFAGARNLVNNILYYTPKSDIMHNRTCKETVYKSGVLAGVRVSDPPFCECESEMLTFK